MIWGRLFPYALFVKRRGHGRGPKALEVVLGWPTGSGITGESRSGDRNGGAVNAVQRRDPPSGGPLRWTLHVVCSFPYTNVGNAGGAVFGADVVPRRATPPISTNPIPAQDHHCPNSVMVLLVRLRLWGSGLQAGISGLGAGRERAGGSASRLSLRRPAFAPRAPGAPRRSPRPGAASERGGLSWLTRARTLPGSSVTGSWRRSPLPPFRPPWPPGEPGQGGPCRGSPPWRNRSPLLPPGCIQTPCPCPSPGP